MTKIKKVAVLGSGVMGASIAAHMANAGVSVVLMDLPQGKIGKKNGLAKEAIGRLLKMNPAPLMHKKKADLITPSHLDALEDLADCDWVIEAVIEKIDIKKDLYKKVFEACGPDTIVSSNTSTLPLWALTEDMDSDHQKRFFISHFFNPPRYMPLLEWVWGEKTDKALCQKIWDFCEDDLGKTLVEAHDTPSFIANRIGTYWLQTALLEARAMNITVEEADAVLGRPFGIPKTGAFALMDLVGLDLMPLIGESMRTYLPKEDPYCAEYQDVPWLQALLDSGHTGRKGKGGFFKMTKDSEGQKKFEALDLDTGTYRPKVKPRLACLDISREGMARFMSFPENAACYARRVMAKTLSYALHLVPEVANSLYDVDRAMCLGYNWKYGPFEMADRIGSKHLKDFMIQEGVKVPPLLESLQGGSFYKVQEGQKTYLNREGTYEAILQTKNRLLLCDIKRRSKPLLKNASAALWDIGDGIACLEFTSKMNAIDPMIMEMIHKSIDWVQEKNLKALVLYNEGRHFSAGANLGLALFAINLGMWDQIEAMVKGGQEAYMALQRAPFPVVGAPSGMALGGGCEILLHCDHVQAHSELYMGLVEVGVGLVPAWGGCKEMMTRWLTDKKKPGGAMAGLSHVFEMIATAKVAKSAFEAQDMLFLKEHDAITMHRDNLLRDAKDAALNLVEGYKPLDVEGLSLKLPGKVARVAFSMAVKGFVKMGKATPYDADIAEKLSMILSGGDTDLTHGTNVDTLLRLEREAFMTLLHQEKTLDRMAHILETGKPLRN